MSPPPRRPDASRAPRKWQAQRAEAGELTDLRKSLGGGDFKRGKPAKDDDDDDDEEGPKSSFSYAAAKAELGLGQGEGGTAPTDGATAVDL